LKRRNFLLGELRRLTNVVSHIPEGAFYVLPYFGYYANKETPTGKVLKDARDLSMYLLEEAHVAMTPGEAFGAPWALRLSYAVNESKLKLAVDKIQAALSKLN
jgi:aspartate aminotransferase